MEKELHNIVGLGAIRQRDSETGELVEQLLSVNQLIGATVNVVFHMIWKIQVDIRIHDNKDCFDAAMESPKSPRRPEALNPLVKIRA